MFALWVVVACAAIAGLYGLVDAHYLQQTPQIAAVSLAQSMSAYRQALIAYAIANPGFTGSAPANALAAFAGGQALNTVWRNYVVPNTDAPGSLVVVYTPSATAAASLGSIETLAANSALAGIAHAGTVVSPGNPAVPLPAAIASAVPDGTPVWMAQAWQP